MNRRSKASTPATNVVTMPVTGDFRRLFAQSSVRHNFILTLTGPMLETLCAIADGCVRDRDFYWAYSAASPNNWVPACEPLVKRGLVYHVPRELQPRETAEEFHRGIEEGTVAHAWKLTPIGEALVAMLKVAGLFVKCDAAIARDERERKKNR